MSVRAMRRAAIVFGLTVLAMVVAALLLWRYAVRYPDRPLGEGGAELTVEIPRGANFTRVTKILRNKGLIESGAAFRIFANYKGVASKVRAGTYTFETDITPRKLLDILVHGVPAPTVTVLIPEGKNMLEVADILAEARVAPREKLVREMRNRRFLHRIGVTGETIEGYLFPDTYKLRAYTPAQEILEHLVRRHKNVYYALRSKHRSGLAWLRKRLRWGHHEIVTLASIVEKETGQAHERPLIAGVFLNRLTFGHFQPKLLQTDPTIIYGCTVPRHKSRACRKFKGRIRRIHLDDEDNPYNTYTNTGLPPGPIANPGRAALEAVLSPKRSRYLFFVSKNDGTHKFSSSRAEHDRAVAKYQLGKGSTSQGGD
jgi:UPF0755 protein